MFNSFQAVENTIIEDDCCKTDIKRKIGLEFKTFFPKKMNVLSLSINARIYIKKHLLRMLFCVDLKLDSS